MTNTTTTQIAKEYNREAGFFMTRNEIEASEIVIKDSGRNWVSFVADGNLYNAKLTTTGKVKKSSIRKYDSYS